MQSFLRLVNFYRRYVQRSSDLTETYAALRKKECGSYLDKSTSGLWKFKNSSGKEASSKKIFDPWKEKRFNKQEGQNYNGYNI